jgi:cytochrome P450
LNGEDQLSLPSLPLPQPDLLDVPPRALELQAQAPLSKVRTPAGDEAWLVTRYAEARELYNDDRLSASHRCPERAPRLSASGLLGGPGGNFETEQSDRAKMREHLAPFFSAGRMRAFRPRVEALTEAAFDDIERAGSPTDLHEQLSVRLPVTVICELLGVPVVDRELFREWTQGVADLADKKRSDQSLTSLLGYTRELVELRRREPVDGLISELCEQGFPDSYVSFLATVLLFAGHETTVVRIDYGILLLLRHPDQRDAMLADPGILGSAVDEVLRTVVHGGVRETFRYAREDIDVGGVTVKEGDLVILYSAAANRDKRVFDDPAAFDVSRPRPPHLTLGYGSHYCLGAPLVRIELETVLERVFLRFPGLRLAVPPDQLEGRPDVLTGGLARLPVAW